MADECEMIWIPEAGAYACGEAIVTCPDCNEPPRMPDSPDSDWPAVEDPGTGGGGTSTGGGGGSGDPDTVTQTEEEVAWGKLLKLLRKAKDALANGKDLSKLSTWKDILGEEWATIAGCVGNVGEVLTGGSMTTMLNCAADFAIGFKGDDIISGLKNVGVFQDMMAGLRNTSPGLFKYFTESLTSMDDLYDVAKLEQDGSNFIIPHTNGAVMFQNIGEMLGGNVVPGPNGLSFIRDASGTTLATLYDSSTPPYHYRSIELFVPFGPRTSTSKLRFPNG